MNVVSKIGQIGRPLRIKPMFSESNPANHGRTNPSSALHAIKPGPTVALTNGGNPLERPISEQLALNVSAKKKDASTLSQVCLP